MTLEIKSGTNNLEPSLTLKDQISHSLTDEPLPASNDLNSSYILSKSETNGLSLAGAALAFRPASVVAREIPKFVVLPGGLGAGGGAGGATAGEAALGATLGSIGLAVASLSVAGLVYYNETHGGAVDIFTYYGDLVFDWLHPEDKRSVSPEDIEEASRRLRARQRVEMQGLSQQEANAHEGLDSRGNLADKSSSNPFISSSPDIRGPVAMAESSGGSGTPQASSTSDSPLKKRAADFWAQFSTLNEKLKVYDEASQQKRAGKDLTPEQGDLLNNETLKSLDTERLALVKANIQHHNLSSASTPDSEMREHIETHLNTADVGSFFNLGDKAVFKDGSAVIQFAEKLLTQAYKSENFYPGNERSISIQAADGRNVQARARFMNSGEMTNGVSVGPSVPGGRVVIQVLFNEPVGQEGVKELKSGEEALSIERISGGRRENAYLVDGKKSDTNVMYIIGGSYGPTGQYGLYTTYTGFYSPPMMDRAYWDTHAFLSGEVGPSYTRNPDGKIFVRSGSNLHKMATPDADGKAKLGLPKIAEIIPQPAQAAGAADTAALRQAYQFARTEREKFEVEASQGKYNTGAFSGFEMPDLSEIQYIDEVITRGPGLQITSMAIRTETPVVELTELAESPEEVQGYLLVATIEDDSEFGSELGMEISILLPHVTAKEMISFQREIAKRHAEGMDPIDLKDWAEAEAVRISERAQLSKKLPATSNESE